MCINFKREKIILKRERERETERKKRLNVKEKFVWMKILRRTTTDPVADLGKLVKF